MLSGKNLGVALLHAIEIKSISKAQLARDFDVTPQSISAWVNYGRIHKKHIQNLVQYFLPEVSSSHWGLAEASAPELPLSTSAIEVAKIFESLTSAKQLVLLAVASALRDSK
jgi:hypothetical protein